MFAGVGSSGVYRITNSDTAWVAVNDGFGGARTVSGLGILGGDLFAALFSANVYRRALSQIVTPVGPVGGDLPSAHSLDQNYPNPFNPSTTISFTVPATEFVTLKVFDVYGREVATLVSGELVPGGHTAEWKAEGAASGVYYARLQAATFSQTRKLLLMR
jgi:hypothetical protein